MNESERIRKIKIKEIKKIIVWLRKLNEDGFISSHELLLVIFKILSSLFFFRFHKSRFILLPFLFSQHFWTTRTLLLDNFSSNSFTVLRFLGVDFPVILLFCCIFSSQGDCFVVTCCSTKSYTTSCLLTQFLPHSVSLHFLPFSSLKAKKLLNFMKDSFFIYFLSLH